MAEAIPFKKETTATCLPEAEFRLVTRDDGTLHLETDLQTGFAHNQSSVVRGSVLGSVRFVGADFEEADGSDVVFDVDLVSATLPTDALHAPGPLAALPGGTTSTLVWATTAAVTRSKKYFSRQ